jgi:small-conductance mechanosensitive channel
MSARIILICFGATVLFIAVRRMRSYRLKERHMLIFLFTGLPFLLLAIWPSAIGWFALKLHVQYQTVSLLCVAAFLILVIFELLTIVSLQDRKISTLAQIVGILMEKHGISDRPTGEDKPIQSPDPARR